MRDITTADFQLQEQKMRVRDPPELDVVVDGEMKEMPAATFGDTHITKDIGANPISTSSDLLYQFHHYIRHLERAHETCQFDQVSIQHELATEKEKNRILNHKVSFLERRIAMLEAALTKREPSSGLP